MKRISGVNAVLMTIMLLLIVMTWRSVQLPRTDNVPKKRLETEKTSGGTTHLDVEAGRSLNAPTVNHPSDGKPFSKVFRKWRESEGFQGDGEPAFRKDKPIYRPLFGKEAATVSGVRPLFKSSGADKDPTGLVTQIIQNHSRLRSG